MIHVSSVVPRAINASTSSLLFVSHNEQPGPLCVSSHGNVTTSVHTCKALRVTRAPNNQNKATAQRKQSQDRSDHSWLHYVHNIQISACSSASSRSVKTTQGVCFRTRLLAIMCVEQLACWPMVGQTMVGHLQPGRQRSIRARLVKQGLLRSRKDAQG
jgi:hypothetical protein